MALTAVQKAVKASMYNEFVRNTSDDDAAAVYLAALSDDAFAISEMKAFAAKRLPGVTNNIANLTALLAAETKKQTALTAVS